MAKLAWTERVRRFRPRAAAPTTQRTARYGSPLGILLFLLPGVGVYTLLMLYPSLMSLYFSLLKWEGGPIAQAPVVGLDNFRQMAQDAYVRLALLNNGRLLALNWTFQLPLALLLAYVLSRLRRGASLYRFLFYVPVVLPAATLALMWRFIFSGNDYGLLNNVLRGLGLEGLVRGWLSADGVVQWTTTFPPAWQYVGFFMVIFLAALAGIPDEYYEAAAIDGANSWQQLRYITLPNLRPVYISAMILALQGALGGFIYPVLMTKGGPIHLSETLISYSLYLLWERKVWGYGSAVAVLSFLLGIIAVALVWRFGREREVGFYR
jgi:raffinose/stachyose/melibiose transport system permease protein